MSTLPPSLLQAAAEDGRRAALFVDRSLRDAERRHRDSVLAALRPAQPGQDEVRRASATALPPDLARLQREHAQLAAFHAAVMSSLGWRLLQALRRLVGRAW